MADDFSDDIFTTGVLSVGGATSGVFEVDDDTDWFRFEIEKYQTYLLVPNNQTVRTAIFDRHGQPFFDPYRNEFRFLAPFSGSVFLAVTEPTGKYRVTDYSIETSIPGDDNTNFFNRRNARVRNVEQDSFIAGIIETGDDRDIMSYMFARGTQVTLTVHGSDSSDATLADPNAGVYRIVGSDLERLGADNNSGPGRSAQVTFRVPETELVYFDINSAGNGTGSYQLSVNVLDDFLSTRQTTGRLTSVLNWPGTQPVDGTLETRNDVDSFYLNVQAGNWYNVLADQNANPRILVYNADSELVSNPPIVGDHDGLRKQGLFFAESSGDFFVSIESHGHLSGSGRRNLGDYSLIVDAQQPTLDPVDVLVNHVRVRTPVEFVSDFEFDSIQLFSEKHLQMATRGALLAPKRVHQFAESTPPWITVPVGSQGSSDIWIRAHEPLSAKWTSWKKIKSLGLPISKSSNDRRGLHVGTYAFADALPAYFDGDPMLDGFEVFSNEERQAFRDALTAWNIRDVANPENSLSEIAPGPDNDAAEIMIFKSNLSQHVYVVPNDWDANDSSLKRADFVVDSDSAPMNDLAPGNQGFFELLRGVGQLFGLREYTNDRSISVMGERFGANVDNLPWTVTPLPIDLYHATPFRAGLTQGDEQPKDYAIFATNPGSDKYQFLDGTSSYSTVMDSGGNDRISAAGVNLATTIDLQPGAPSYTGTNGNQWQTLVIAYDSIIENAIGGNYFDHISGNRFSNNLIGNNGNDVLNGRAGSDRLYGGTGSDRYVFEIGDGRDTINEQDSGGLDQLNVIGFDSLDSLDDFTFQRLGNDLLVRFKLDGNNSHIEDSIRIRNMGSPRSRVEQFKLDDIRGNNLVSASLVSVFANATHEPKRFQLAGGADRFGDLVAPI